MFRWALILFLSGYLVKSCHSSPSSTSSPANSSCLLEWLISAGIPRTQATSYEVNLRQNQVAIASFSALSTFLFRLIGITSADHQKKLKRCALTSCNSPCRNSGQCLSRQKDGTYFCQCAVGFVGDRCATDVCKPHPCQNNGTCSHSEAIPTGYTCICIPGFEGNACEIRIDMCKTKPCQNGARCIPLVNDFRCACRPTFHGRRCGRSWISKAEYDDLKSDVQTLAGRFSNFRSDFSSRLSSYRSNFASLLREVRKVIELTSWTPFNVPPKRCYYKLFVETLNFDSAQARCVSHGANLVSVTSGHEQAFINSLVGSRATYCWLGATDREREGHWKWLDGSVWGRYSNWSPRQPDNHRNEDCLEMVRGGGEWNDIPCPRRATAFLCKTCL